MKRIFSLLPLFICLTMALSGCILRDVVQITDPSMPLGGLPQAQDDPDSGSADVSADADEAVSSPESGEDAGEKEPETSGETTPAVTAPETDNSGNAPAGEVPVRTEQPAPVRSVAPPEQPPRSPENFRRGAGAWRVFSRLSPEEQSELLRLQRTDPERFRAVMAEKADQLYARIIARQRELDDLVRRCRECTDAAEKERLTAELREKLREDFQQRLQDMRRDIEYTRRKAAALETDLNRRESNFDAIIEALLQSKLSGNPPPRPPQPGN